MRTPSAGKDVEPRELPSTADKECQVRPLGKAAGQCLTKLGIHSPQRSHSICYHCAFKREKKTCVNTEACTWTCIMALCTTANAESNSEVLQLLTSTQTGTPPHQRATLSRQEEGPTRGTAARSLGRTTQHRTEDTKGSVLRGSVQTMPGKGRTIAMESRSTVAKDLGKGQRKPLGW